MAAKLGVKLASTSLTGARLLSRSSSKAPASRRCSTLVVDARKVDDKLPATVAGLAATSGLAAAPAQAQDVDSAVASVIDLVKAGGEAAKTGLSAAQTGVEYASKALEQVVPVVKGAVGVAAPVVTDALKATADVAAPVLATGVEEAKKVLEVTGVDTAALAGSTKVAVETTGQAAQVAKPLLEQAITFLTTTDPTLLGEYALGLVALYYIGPPVLKLAFGALRGYAGEVTPAAALDAVQQDASAVLLDIRVPREKETAGLVDLPNNGKLLELELATIEDRKLRSQLRNVGQLEIVTTALQIASLKRLSKSSPVFLLDRNGSLSKAVARELARRGFSRVFVVAGGFQGWQNAKLRTRLSNTVSRVEVLNGSILGSRASIGTARTGTVQVLPQVGARTQRALPSPRS